MTANGVGLELLQFIDPPTEAPPPLAYFCTGFVACLMTQLRAFSKRLRVPVGGMTVKAYRVGSARRGPQPL